jgi:alpha-D-xyloside xylohydrolase
MKRISLSLAVFSGLLLCWAVAPACGDSVTSFAQVADGVEFVLATGRMKVQVCRDDILRVIYTKQSTWPPAAGYVVVKATWPALAFQAADAGMQVTVTTAKVKAIVTKATATIEFQTTGGQSILAETAAKTLTSKTVQGVTAYEGTIVFNSPADEGLYGFGQFQNSELNMRGQTLDLVQTNLTDASPVFVSTRGFGILWNTFSQVKLTPPLNLWCGWAANDAVDYYFMYGPEFDQIIAAYRTITGPAPLWPKWAYGFWQCRNYYASQTEILNVVKGYRDRNLPIDNVVQDWNYYPSGGNGSFHFDPSRYPSPATMINTLHTTYNCHFTISVWPSFTSGNSNYALMSNKGFLLNSNDFQGTTYDAFNDSAAAQYWRFLRDSLLAKGVDGWWPDATEPETNSWTTCITQKGPAQKVLNIFPLVHGKTIYEGQRAVSTAKRVCLLARSFYAGQQRYGAAYWTGDIQSDFATLAKSVSSGMNFCLTGMPYWCTDVGGFYGMPSAELESRWFEFGAFCPIFRVHGTRDCNELWCSQWSGAYATLTAYSKLRYRMFPYVYSLAYKTTSEGYTMYRALPFDFRTDPQVRNTRDEFMFGPAFLACPVLTSGATSRNVYLPAGTWYDFWTGQTIAGGRSITAAAPVETMPLYVRAGAIVPLGPEILYSAQKADPIEIRVFTGANGAFTLHEDEGDNYNYENGSFATIPITWNEATQDLTIGPTSGSFPGMIASRTFNIVWVGQNHGSGGAVTSAPDKAIPYTGASVTLNKTTGQITGAAGLQHRPHTSLPIIRSERGAIIAQASLDAGSAIAVMAPDGRVVAYASVIAGFQGAVADHLAAGTYIVRCATNGATATSRMAVLP